MRPAPQTMRPASATIVHNGPVFKVWQWDQELFDGQVRRFETISRADTVLVLPITEDDAILLGMEEQPGLQRRLHALGGRLEEGESPEDAARRELLEEAGVSAERIILWQAWQPVTKLDWAVYLFWAGGLEHTSGGPTTDGGERIEVRKIPARELLGFEGVGQIEDRELEYQLGRAALIADERDRMLHTFAEAKGGGY